MKSGGTPGGLIFLTGFYFSFFTYITSGGVTNFSQSGSLRGKVSPKMERFFCFYSSVHIQFTNRVYYILKERLFDGLIRGGT